MAVGLILYALSINTLLGPVQQAAFDSAFVLISSILAIFCALLVVEIDYVLKQHMEEKERERLSEENSALLGEYLDDVNQFARDMDFDIEDYHPKYKREYVELDVHETLRAPLYRGVSSYLSAPVRIRLNQLERNLHEVDQINLRLEELISKEQDARLFRNIDDSLVEERFYMEKILVINLRKTRINSIKSQVFDIQEELR